MSTSWIHGVLRRPPDTVMESLYSYHQSWIVRAQITTVGNIELPHRPLLEDIKDPVLMVLRNAGSLAMRAE